MKYIYNNTLRIVGAKDASDNEQGFVKAFKIGFAKFKESLKDHKKRTIFITLVVIFLAWWVTGAFVQFVMEDEISFAPWDCIIETFFYPLSLVLWLVICCSSAMCIMRWSRMLHKDYIIDERTGTKISVNDNTYGSAHFMDEKEKQKYLEMDKDVNWITKPILGIDEKKRVCARDDTVRFTNSNVIIFGPPGSGKSVCIINNDVLQAVKAGQSIIVVDTKGAVYKDTAYVGEKAGYNVKIFNTKPDEVQYSDACDILANIKYDNTRQGINKAKGIAASIVNIIMEQTHNERDKGSIWYTGAQNLLTALILIVKWDQTIPENKRTLGKVYEILVEQKNYTSIEATYGDIASQKGHPAYEAWQTFSGSTPIVKESVYGGLMTSLYFMSSEDVREILSNEEISFSAPGFEKCIYYIVIPDNDNTNKVLSTLFIEQLFRALTSAADSMEEAGEMRLPVTVNFEIDEAKQVGKLSMFVEKLSSVRSRGINIKTVFQDLSQVKQLYPNDEWRTVISDCTTMIVLRIGNDNDFAEYISRRLGSFTYYEENESYNENVADPIHLHESYGVRGGRGQRALMTPQELQGNGTKGLKDEELLVIINGAGVTRLDMFMWWLHPYYKLLHLDNIKTKRFTKHRTPEWSKRMYGGFSGDTANTSLSDFTQPQDHKNGIKKISLSQENSGSGRPERRPYEENVNGRKVVKAKSLRR